MTPHRSLYRIEGYADLWVDACLRNDEGELMFLSFYGRDASAMQFIAAAELGSQAEAGISRFALVEPAASVSWWTSGLPTAWPSSAGGCHARTCSGR